MVAATQAHSLSMSSFTRASDTAVYAIDGADDFDINNLAIIIIKHPRRESETRVLRRRQNVVPGYSHHLSVIHTVFHYVYLIVICWIDHFHNQGTHAEEDEDSSDDEGSIISTNKEVIDTVAADAAEQVEPRRKRTHNQGTQPLYFIHAVFLYLILS
jgi:hypothetical protein